MRKAYAVGAPKVAPEAGRLGCLARRFDGVATLGGVHVRANVERDFLPMRGRGMRLPPEVIDLVLWGVAQLRGHVMPGSRQANSQ